MKEIQIMERPEAMSYDAIHDVIYAAHEQNRREGFHVKTAEMSGDEIREHIGPNGRCFVAMDGEKIVGVTAVRIIHRNNHFAKGKVADQILIAVLPAYSGKHISSKLHQKVLEFAREKDLKQVELRTAFNNKKMQRTAQKWGFQHINFVAYKGLDHYTVVMMKWLNYCPYPTYVINLYYNIRKALVKHKHRRDNL